MKEFWFVFQVYFFVFILADTIEKMIQIYEYTIMKANGDVDAIEERKVCDPVCYII